MIPGSLKVAWAKLESTKNVSSPSYMGIPKEYLVVKYGHLQHKMTRKRAWAHHRAWVSGKRKADSNTNNSTHINTKKRVVMPTRSTKAQKMGTCFELIFLRRRVRDIFAGPLRPFPFRNKSVRRRMRAFAACELCWPAVTRVKRCFPSGVFEKCARTAWKSTFWALRGALFIEWTIIWTRDCFIFCSYKKALKWFVFTCKCCLYNHVGSGIHADGRLVISWTWLSHTSIPTPPSPVTLLRVPGTAGYNTVFVAFRLYHLSKLQWPPSITEFSTKYCTRIRLAPQRLLSCFG